MIPKLSTLKIQVADGKMGKNHGHSGKQLTLKIPVLLVLLFREIKENLMLAVHRNQD